MIKRRDAVLTLLLRLLARGGNGIERLLRALLRGGRVGARIGGGDFFSGRLFFNKRRGRRFSVGRRFSIRLGGGLGGGEIGLELRETGAQLLVELFERVLLDLVRRIRQRLVERLLGLRRFGGGLLKGLGKMARGLAKCIVDADYLINSSLLKTHVGPGVTLTSKNWYGATDINLLWQKNQHNGFNQDKRNGIPKYSSQVDFIGHKDLGGKCLLFLIDGTYGSRDVNGKPDPKWQKAPFNGEWACSVIMSQDPLAGDSVGLDILANEWPEVGSLPFCDLYLVEAASLPNPPSGTVYDPEADGKPLAAPLGLTEHWNAKHEYKAIDLIYKKL